MSTLPTIGAPAPAPASAGALTTALPPISAAPAPSGPNKGGGGGVDIGELLGETLSKLIAEKRGTGMLSTMGDQAGRVSLEEFTDAVVPLGLAPAEVSLIFGHFDKERTGFIDFDELHAELTQRVSKRGGGRKTRKASHLNQFNRDGPYAPGGATDLRPHKLSDGGIQKGLPMSKSAAGLLQTPTWDPMKGKLDAAGFKGAPLWRDDALDAAGGSRSLMRALASTGSLVRPSVTAAEEHSKKRDAQRMLERQASSASSFFKPKLVRPSHPELIGLKSGEAEQFIGKIHDEELVQQQLQQAAHRIKDKIGASERALADPLVKDIDRVLAQQSRLIEGRGNSLLAKANDIRAQNGTLREDISKLRLERRLHHEFKQGLIERLADLNKQVPSLVDRVNQLLFEGEKVQTKVIQTHQDALQQRVQQEELLQDSTEQLVG